MEIILELERHNKHIHNIIQGSYKVILRKRKKEREIMQEARYCYSTASSHRVGGPDKHPFTPPGPFTSLYHLP